MCACLQEWVALVDMPKMEWKESVNLVFDYFSERTPRSFVEARDTSVVWNYKYAGQSAFFQEALEGFPSMHAGTDISTARLQC